MTRTGRQRAIWILDRLREDWNLSDKEILEYIIYNNLSGSQAEEVMLDACQEFDCIPFGEDEDSQ
jgi:hypothetical protein